CAELARDGGAAGKISERAGRGVELELLERSLEEGRGGVDGEPCARRRRREHERERRPEGWTRRHHRRRDGPWTDGPPRRARGGDHLRVHACSVTAAGRSRR